MREHSDVWLTERTKRSVDYLGRRTYASVVCTRCGACVGETCVRLDGRKRNDGLLMPISEPHPERKKSFWLRERAHGC